MPRKKTFMCSFPDCSALYDREWKLEAHLCKHTGVRPFPCSVEGCSKSFCTKSHLTRHQLTHTGERPFRCTEEGCTEGFTTNFNLKKHISRKHRFEQKHYVCMFEGCGKRFKKNNQLKSHECTHTNLLPYECSYEGCEKRFMNPSKRKQHEKVHKGYPCTAEGCSFTGKNWTEFVKHKKEHKVRLQCDKCARSFRDQWFLRQHQKVHSEERVVFRCPKEGCLRSYTSAFNLQSHLLSFHEPERPFTCPQDGCHKTFCMRQSLQRHSVVHDPERKKQKKPRPRRTLASRLSGFNPSRLRPAAIPPVVTSQSERFNLKTQVGDFLERQREVNYTRTLDSRHTTMNTLVSYSAEITPSPSTEHPEIGQSDSCRSDPEIILILEPLELDSPAESQSEPIEFENAVTVQLQQREMKN
ncbi:general transcription factor IIIAa [Hoplias malabaricus]|uniref:general transcription factor IIIAa n=1 Tax=Hoplias malabaricus TaxID=27720 RepID=UPI0034625817